MAIIPRLGTFQAPPPVVPQGLATRAPSAMARATGTGMTTNQGQRVPGLQGRDTGLGSLVSDMTQEIDNVKTSEELTSTMFKAGRQLSNLYSKNQGEIYPSEDPNRRTLLTAATDEGVLTAAQSNVNAVAQAKVNELNSNFTDDSEPFTAIGDIIYKDAGERGKLVEFGAIASDGTFIKYGSESDTVPVGGEDISASPTAPASTAAPASIDPSLPVIPGAITNEQARQIAKDTIGITGGESEEDAYTALMMFGLGLMATPGPLGEAIGKAGLNVMPQITKARQAQRARRKDVGVMAYNIREKNKAQRVAARSAQLKQFNEDRGLALDLYKQQNAQFTKQLDTYLKDALPGVPAKVMNHAQNPDFAKIFGKVRTLGRTPEGMSQIMTKNGETLAQLAISSAIRSGDIKEGDLANYQDPGWTKYVQRDPDRPGWTRSMLYATKQAYAKHPITEKVGTIEPGTEFALDEWAPPNPKTPVTLWSFNSKTGEISQTTESGIAEKAKDAFLEREANVLSIIDLADQSSILADEGALFATSEMFSLGPKVASYLDAAIASIAPGNTKLREQIRIQTNKFTGALNKYLGKDLAVSKSKKYSDRGLLLNGQKISGKSGVASWLKKIEDEGFRKGIADEEGFTDVQRAAFNNLASLQPRVRAMMFNMAYAVARAAEPGGRLTDRDVANAMMQLGGDKAGNIASPEIFKDVLQQTVRQTAERHQASARAQPDKTGFPDYTIQKRWDKVQRTLTGAPKELPAWVLQGGTTAAAQDQTAAAGQPQVEKQVAQTDRLRNSIVNAPIAIGDQTTSLSQSYPFFAQDMIDPSGRLRTEKETMVTMGIPWGTPDAGKKGLEEIKNRIAAQEDLAVSDPKVLAKAIQTVQALQNFYKNPDAAAQLRSYLQPPYAPLQ
jgi:hypothetical protein